MARRRLLPKYVSAFIDIRGKERLRFRRKGYPGGYFTANLGTEAFREQYHAFMHPEAAPAPNKAPRAAEGTLDDLIDRYCDPITRLGPTKVTQEKVRAVLEDFRKGRGDRPVRLVTFEALDKIIAKKREKTVIPTASGERTIGGVHAARKLRKELVRLFTFAHHTRMIDHNPALLTQKVKATVDEKRGGFVPWTEDDITRYREHHALGTRERLAMELLLWTDQRRSDIVKMGRAQIKDGRIPVIQEKTGAVLWIALAPQLLEAIVAMPPHLTSPFCFLVNKRGKPFTKESFGNWFREACIAAGVEHGRAHGLRKATLRRMADLQMSNKTMKAVSGQKRDEMIELYTADADQMRLADKAIAELSTWERAASNVEPRLDIDKAQGIGNNE